MMTVAQVSKRTGVSVRTLHHYDQIGLLKPTEVTEVGYRLYDDTALDKLYMILVYRELGLSLNEIGSILDAPDYDRNRVLEHQIKLMQERVEKLQNRISFARGMLRLRGFEPKQPLSSSFCCFLPYLPCLASARRRHLCQKSIKNNLLRGALQFSAGCVFQDEENHADNTLCIIKGFSDVLGNATA